MLMTFKIPHLNFTIFRRTFLYLLIVFQKLERNCSKDSGTGKTQYPALIIEKAKGPGAKNQHRVEIVTIYFTRPKRTLDSYYTDT